MRSCAAAELQTFQIDLENLLIFMLLISLPYNSTFKHFRIKNYCLSKNEKKIYKNNAFNIFDFNF